jgi:putative ABC transport system permease protein
VIVGQGIGPRLVGEPVREIIGVVADTHNNGLGRPPDPMRMVPVAQVTDGYVAAYSDIQLLLWVVRTRGDPHQAMAAVAEQASIQMYYTLVRRIIQGGVK